MVTKKAILCVDDEAIIVFSLKQELSNYYGDRYIYESAMNADDAIELVDELTGEGTDVCLIITDWLMPGLKGDEFLIRLKDRHPEIKSILITGQADETAIQRAKEVAGVTAVLEKPWFTEDLINAVKTCLD